MRFPFSYATPHYHPMRLTLVKVEGSRDVEDLRFVLTKSGWTEGIKEFSLSF
jgi:hypothetical protein